MSVIVRIVHYPQFQSLLFAVHADRERLYQTHYVPAHYNQKVKCAKDTRISVYKLLLRSIPTSHPHASPSLLLTKSSASS